jgi:hypothetical protein
MPPPPCDRCPCRGHSSGGAAPPPPSPPALFLLYCTAAVCYMACLNNMVIRLMINAAGWGAPSSPSRGALTSATQDLAAHHAVRLLGGVAPGRVVNGKDGGRGGGTGSVARPPLMSCRAEYARVLPAGRWESQTRTCAGRRHGLATTGALRG